MSIGVTEHEIPSQTTTNPPWETGMKATRSSLSLVVGTATALLLAGCGSSTSTSQSGDTSSSSSSSSSNAGSTSGTGTSGTIKIVHIQPLTGESGYLGRQAMQGSQAAVEVINANGGVLGKKLEMLEQDDASESSQTVSLMKQFGPNEDTAAIIGPTYSTDFIAASPFAEKYRVPLISAGSTAPWPGKFNDWTFRSSVPGAVFLPELIDTVKTNTGAKTVALIYETDNKAPAEQAKLAEAEFPKHGIDVVEVTQAMTTTTDFGPQVTSIMQHSPDLIAMGMYTATASLFLQQLANAGYEGSLMAISNTLLDPKLYEQSNGHGEGLAVPTSFIVDTSQPQIDEFVSTYKEMFGEVPGAQEAFGYDAVGLLANAMREANTTTDRAAISDALAHTTSYQGVQGPFTFNGPGDNTTPAVHVVKLTKDGFVPFEDEG